MREKGKSKKRQRGGESGVREQRLHVAVEGVLWLWRGTNSQVRQTLSLDEFEHLSCVSSEGSSVSSFTVIERLLLCSKPESIFPSLVFSTLSFCPVC